MFTVCKSENLCTVTPTPTQTHTSGVVLCRCGDSSRWFLDNDIFIFTIFISLHFWWCYGFELKVSCSLAGCSTTPAMPLLLCALVILHIRCCIYCLANIDSVPPTNTSLVPRITYGYHHAWLIDMGFTKFLPRLASNRDLPDLWSSWDCRHAIPYTTFVTFWIFCFKGRCSFNLPNKSLASYLSLGIRFFVSVCHGTT